MEKQVVVATQSNNDELCLNAKFVKKCYEGRDGYLIAFFKSPDIEKMPQSIQEKYWRTVESRGKKVKNVSFTAMGTGIPQIENVEIKLYGKFTYNTARKQWQFKTSRYEMDSEPLEQRAMLAFLSSDIFKGVGQVKAANLVKTFGTDIYDVIKNKPEALTQAEGIDEELAQSIHDAYEANSFHGEVIKYLEKFELKPSLAEKIYRAYGKDTEEKIENHPYDLKKDVGISFAKADEIAKKTKSFKVDAEERIRGFFIATHSALRRMSGDTYVSSYDLYNETAKILNDGFQRNSDGSAAVSKERIREVYEAMLKDESFFEMESKNVRNRGVFTGLYYKAEENVAKVLTKMMSVSTYSAEQWAKIYDLAKVINSKKEHPVSGEQFDAVLRSLTTNCAIITGGPGTGKTTVLSFLIEMYQNIYKGMPITLLAPTGKAARRMSESTGFPAKTIHSALRLGGVDDESQNSSAPNGRLDAGLIIIDEMSMVDSLLMDKLCEALDRDDVWKETKLIMVGDTDQLPSVGAGAVLEQLIASNCIVVSKLTKTFRQSAANGGTIIGNAHKINEGDSNLSYDQTFQMIESRDEIEALNNIKRVYAAKVAEWGIDNVALLSPLRKNSGDHICCSDELNPVLQNICNPRKDGEKYIKIDGKEFRTHDRVMKWKNGSVSANGDVGEITDIDAEHGCVLIHWEGGEDEVINEDDMGDVSLAYSMSVHKSQGSEYNCVIIPVISEQRCPLFKRNLLYTGVTRAKKEVILVGDKDAVRIMCETSDNNVRLSALGTILNMYCRVSWIKTYNATSFISQSNEYRHVRELDGQLVHTYGKFYMYYDKDEKAWFYDECKIG